LERANVVSQVRDTLNQISEDMRAKALAASNGAIQDLDSLDKVPEKVVRFGWCGEEECGRKFEEKTGLKMLGSPYNKEEYHGKCIVCHKAVENPTYAARSM